MKQLQTLQQLMRASELPISAIQNILKAHGVGPIGRATLSRWQKGRHLDSRQARVVLRVLQTHFSQTPSLSIAVPDHPAAWVIRLLTDESKERIPELHRSLRATRLAIRLVTETKADLALSVPELNPAPHHHLCRIGTYTMTVWNPPKYSDKAHGDTNCIAYVPEICTLSVLKSAFPEKLFLPIYNETFASLVARKAFRFILDEQKLTAFENERTHYMQREQTFFSRARDEFKDEHVDLLFADPLKATSLEVPFGLTISRSIPLENIVELLSDLLICADFLKRARSNKHYQSRLEVFFQTSPRNLSTILNTFKFEIEDFNVNHFLRSESC